MRRATGTPGKPLQRVVAYAPATVANVACGFDILGFAIDAPGDIVIAERGSRPGLRFADDEPNDGFPRQLKANTAGFAAWSLLQHLGEGKAPISLRLQKGMARGTGLGSSAASAAAAVVAVNTLLGMPLPKRDLLRFAVAGEQKADGAWHADNVAPSLLGGMILIRDNAALDVISLPYPKVLHAVVVHPAVQVLTADARRVLAPKVPQAQWIAQSGDLAALIAALCLGDLALLGRSLNDHIIEPQRKHLIPKYDAVKAAALAAGALGAGISGSGPSIFALAANRATAGRVATAMQTVYRKARLPCNAWVSPINATGAYVKSAS